MLKFYQAQASIFTQTIQLMVTDTGSGLVVQLFGGDKPHLGATVITHPRPSLMAGGGISCNSMVIPELGHKEDLLAKPLAEKIAKTLNAEVVLVAGIHLDGADGAQISEIRSVCWQLVDGFLLSADAG